LDSNSVIQWSNLSAQAQGYVTSAQADATQALSDAGDALSAAEGAEIVSSTIIWQYKSSKSTPAAPTSEVTYTGSNANSWTLNKPGYNSSYIYYYYCYQQEMGDGSFTFTDVMYDAGTSGVYAVASGNFSEVGNTFIKNDEIYSPTIKSGTIEGGIVAGSEFTNLDKAAYLVIGPKEETDTGTVKTYGDLYLYGRNPSTQRKWETFRVKDHVGGASIFLYGAEILAGWNSGTSSNPIPNVTPNGNWDFQFATVTNLPAKFG
jgi:hypothetical protein